MIPNESVLNKIGQIKGNDRAAFSIEALVILIKMVDLSYERLFYLLKKKEQALSEDISMHAWLVVGNMNRLRCLIDKVSGIKKSEPWFQSFTRKVKIVEKTRHIIEHYDGQINSLQQNVKPLLGHISWVEYLNDGTFKIQLLLPGTIKKYKGLGLVNPLGMPARAEIDHINYYLGDESLDLSDLYYATLAFTRELEGYVKKTYFTK